MTTHLAWQHARSVLCVQLGSLGDVLMTAPALRALKEALPGRTVTLLTSTAGSRLAPLLGVVDEVLPYDAAWTAPHRVPDATHDWRLLEHLWRRRFDAAVVFSDALANPVPSVMLAHLANIPLRLAWARGELHALLSHGVPEPEPTTLARHDVRRHLDLISTVGVRATSERLSLTLPPRARTSGALLLEGVGIDSGQPWALVHPGGAGEPQRYRVAELAEVIHLLGFNLRMPVLLVGGGADREVADTLRAAVGPSLRSLVGELNLSQLAAVTSLASAALTLRTAPSQLAAAVGTPVLRLCAPSQAHRAPWGVESRLLGLDASPQLVVRTLAQLHRREEPASPPTILRTQRNTIPLYRMQNPDEGPPDRA
ncbi:MAG: glycosyltransferase family 9 protein [Myxococcota bacterium]